MNGKKYHGNNLNEDPLFSPRIKYFPGSKNDMNDTLKSHKYLVPKHNVIYCPDKNDF